MNKISPRHLIMTLTALSIGLSGCSTSRRSTSAISERPFGTDSQGTPVTLYTLHNKSGAEVSICNYGGLGTSLKVPDRNGNYGDGVLRFDNLADYIKDSPYFGALIGRYGNRIAK